MNDKVTIRKMAENDLDAVAAIEKENFSHPWSRKSFADFIEREDAIFLSAVICDSCGVTQKQEGIAGYIGFYGIPDEGDITNVSVQKEFRQMGIGRMLVNALIDEASKRGIAKIFLEVRESNEPAIHLYRNAGFEKVGTRRNYYEDPQEDAWIMRREEAAF